MIYLQLSSLHKVFLDEDYQVLREVEGVVALKGERVSWQILYTGGLNHRTPISFSVKADNRMVPEARFLGNVPSARPARPYECDEYYLRTKPGLYPDVLYPLTENNLLAIRDNCHSVFFTVTVPEDMDAGEYPIEVNFESEGECVKKTFTIKVLDVQLPAQELSFTQWFHADCIASYYNFDIFSEEHWEMIEKFIEKASYIGINLILTPLFTLPLDTEVGRERPTLQLVDVTVHNGEYTFGFQRLKRWIDMCKRHGICRFEMSHLFAQWGTACTPKIEAMTDEGRKKIFGWHTKADSIEYRQFLNCFLPELISFLQHEGVYEDSYFHVSDEPNYEKHSELYKLEREMLEVALPAEKIIDCISHYEFCDSGLVKKPIAITDSVDKFFEHGYRDIWAYHCCGPCNRGYSNRLMAMPSGRNRIIGTQLYKYGIGGFLHWGYNFYYSEKSIRKINPFVVTDADEGLQSGDAFSVYPGENGPIESLRSVVFYEGLQDYRACKLLESYIGKDAVDRIIEESGTITFNQFPRTDEGVARIRERINRKIEEVLGEEVGYEREFK